MSESTYDQASYSPIPLDTHLIHPGAPIADSHSLDYSDLNGSGTLNIDPSCDNDTEFLSSEAMDIFEAVTDSSSYGKRSPSLLDQQETDYLDFGYFSGLPQDELPLPDYKDDTTYGAIATEEERLAEKWVEEQIYQEDLEKMRASNGQEDSLHDNLLKPVPRDVLDRSRCRIKKPSISLKSPGLIPSSLNPITPVQPNVSSAKSELKRAAKRPASEVSNSSSSQKPVKRRVAKSNKQGTRSESRIRMDEALHEKSRAQLALREALVNLKEAQILERECRARYNSASFLVKTTAEKECEALLREKTPWNNMFYLLKKYKDETGGCNIKHEDSKSPEIIRLVAWIGKIRKHCKLNGKSSYTNMTPATTSSTDSDSKADTNSVKSSSNIMMSQPDAASSGSHRESEEAVATNSPEEHDDASVFEDLDPDCVLADPYKKLALDAIGFDWDPRTSRWNMMYQELKEFKALNGTTLVPHANCGLGCWVKRQQVQYTLYKSGSKSELTEDRVRLLNELGFVWSRRSNTWNENFQRLKRWSEEHGSCNIPDGTDDFELVALSKWAADQRAAYKRFAAEDEANEDSAIDESNTKKKSKKKTFKLCPEQIEALKSIGFEFDARDAKWLQKFDVLLGYKKKHGDFLVPHGYPEDPTLANWVSSQRQQYKLYQRGSKSHMSERRLQILTEAGFPFSSKEELQKRKDEATQHDIDEFDAKPWIEKYKDLLLHIANHASILSLQKINPLLWDWVEQQRQDISSVVSNSDPSSGSSSDPEDTSNGIERKHAELMKIAEAFSSSRGEDFCTPAAKENNLSWDSQFGSLAAWYIKYGTYSNKGMPAKLKKFMLKQQEQQRLLLSGAESELTPDHIEKLNDIYFPFDPNSNKPSENDVAASRRNKSWEEYRLDLAISYVQKGNYDLQSICDIELRRWATEQKRQHKLYLSGKQSSLSLTQIQRLIDIKFISKRPKQFSWPELCGDLMAFRIQFGTFDVASAKVVAGPKASKGIQLNPVLSSTTLNNIKDLFTKLRTARNDFTQEQLQKLTNARFPWDEPAGIAVEREATASNPEAVCLEHQVPIQPITKQIFGSLIEVTTELKQ